MNGMPVYHGELVLAPQLVTIGCGALFEKRCCFRVSISRGTTTPVRIHCTNPACHKVVTINSPSLISKATYHCAFTLLHRAVKLRLKQIRSMKAKLLFIESGLLLDEYLLHWNSVDTILRLRCVCSTFRTGACLETLPYLTPHRGGELQYAQQAQQLANLLRKTPETFVGVLTGAAQCNSTGVIQRLCLCIILQQEEVTFAVSPVEDTVPLPHPYRNMLCMIVGGGMRRTGWLTALTPQVLMKFGFPVLPARSHAVIFFAARYGEPQKRIEEAVHRLPLLGMLSGLTDRIVSMLAQIQSEMTLSLHKVERFIIELEENCFFLLFFQPDIANYLVQASNGQLGETGLEAFFMDGKAMQHPKRAPIQHYMSFDQLRRHRDELSILWVEAFVPLRGAYLLQSWGGFSECTATPHVNQVMLANPITLIANSEVRRPILPQANILQTVLDMFTHFGTPPILAPYMEQESIGVLIKIEFRRVPEVNHNRRGMGGGISLQ